MTTLRAAALAFVLILLPSPARAQVPDALPAPSLQVGAGAAVPVSDDLSFLHGPGPSAAAGLDVPVARHLAVTADVGYTRLLIEENQVTRVFDAAAIAAGAGDLEFDVRGGAYHLASGTAGLRWMFATPGRVAFYLDGGTGLYYSSIGDPDLEARDAEGRVVSGDASVWGGEGLSFGFQAGGGVRLPLAAGVRFFVEPRYALFLDDSHYFSTRAGLSLSDVFAAAAPPEGGWRAPAMLRYELSAGYRGAFFSDGDETGAAYHVEASRQLFSERTGLALAGVYRRAVDTDLRRGLSWTKRRGVSVGLTLFVDALRFETGTAAHRLRLKAGPTLRRQWGERPRGSRTGTREHPVDVERWLEEHDRGHVYSRQLDSGRTRHLFTNAFDETQWGGAFALEYTLALGRFTVGPQASMQWYEGGNVISYGVHVGVPFGATFE